eukprot:2047898-Prymnesium_polylepis.1
MALDGPANREYARVAGMMGPLSRGLAIGNELGRELDTVVMSWAERCRELVGGDRCQILLYREEERQLVCFVPGQTLPLKLSLDDSSHAGILTACAKNNEVVNVKDAKGDTRFNASADSASGYTTHSVLAVPFDNIARGGLCGVCQVLNKVKVADQDTVFTSDDE